MIDGMNDIRVCVTGAAGFIGGHLCRYLRERGYWVRAVDYIKPRYGEVEADETLWTCDLRYSRNAVRAVGGMDWVFALSALMGGAGFVFTRQNDRDILHDNTLINVNTIKAAWHAGVKRYLFSSSACVYPEYLQTGFKKVEDAKACGWALKESDAYPAEPDSAYGWEKLHAEHICRTYHELTDMDVKIVRFHNCFGERGAWTGGREKAPAAMCRKIATAKLTGNPEIEIWGDGTQMRSYIYVADCVFGLERLMRSDFNKPLNMGRDRCVSVDELVDIIAGIAGIEVVKKHVPGPIGVAWRNSDNSLCREVLKWEPMIALEQGLMPTYQWIEARVKESLA